jgi:nitrous oxidase accessory protein
MNRRRSLLLFLITAAAVLATRAETLNVGETGKFRSIASAIATASPGDEIVLAGGVYNENVVLDKQLSISGTDGAQIVGTGTGSVITVIADGCVIRGIRLVHSGRDLRAEDAGILLKSNNNVLEENILQDVLFGIYLFHSDHNVIRGNTITGRTELEVGERGAGLHLWNSADNLIENNIISYTRDGMYVQSSPRNVMNANEVSHLRYGLHFMSSDFNKFEANDFHDNVAGAAIMYSRGIELRRNAFVHNRGFSSFGILFQDCRECVTENNLINNNATGIFLEALRDSAFRRNTISENDVAAQVFSSSENNVFTENNFIDNINPLQMVGKSTSTKWSDGSVGNYWSDYEGYDLDGDSIGDVPYRIQNIFEYLEGSFPRLRLYLNSPAAESMIAAERSFPIIEASKQMDPRPLMYPVATTGTEKFREPTRRSGLIMPIVSLIAFCLSVSVFWRRRSR